MKKNTILVFSLSLLSFLFFNTLFNVSQVCAEGPWKWNGTLTLKKEKQGNKLLFPVGMYVDKERDRYYISDARTNSLYSFDRKGVLLNTLKLTDQLKQPCCIRRDNADVFWIVEAGRSSLTSLDLKDKKIVTHKIEVDGENVFPSRFEIVGSSFYVLDKLTGSIVILGPDLSFVAKFGSGFNDFLVQGDVIWALRTTKRELVKFNNKGIKLIAIDISSHSSFPFAFDVGPADQFYVLDRHAGKVDVYDSSGDFKYNFLSLGQSRGRLYYPEDIMFDPWGNLCLVDSGNGRVEIFAR